MKEFKMLFDRRYYTHGINDIGDIHIIDYPDLVPRNDLDISDDILSICVYDILSTLSSDEKKNTNQINVSKPKPFNPSEK